MQDMYADWRMSCKLAINDMHHIALCYRRLRQHACPACHVYSLQLQRLARATDVPGWANLLPQYSTCWKKKGSRSSEAAYNSMAHVSGDRTPGGGVPSQLWPIRTPVPATCTAALSVLALLFWTYIPMASPFLMLLSHADRVQTPFALLRPSEIRALGSHPFPSTKTSSQRTALVLSSEAC